MFVVLTFVVFFAVLAVALYVTAVFFHGYLYTGAEASLAWQAPAAGAALAAFYALWALLVVRSDAKPGNIPYDTLLRYSPKVELTAEPATELWATYADKKTVRYKYDVYERRYRVDSRTPYRRGSVAFLELAHGGQKRKFVPAPREEGAYRSYASDDGWTMREYEEGPSGLPFRYQWGGFLGNLLLNLFHGAVWFVCLWLVLRYQLAHAIGFALVMWLTMTVTAAPMLLDRAAEAARERQTAAAANVPAPKAANP